MRERIYHIVQRARPGDKVSHAYDVFIVAVAFLSIVPLMFRPQDLGSRVSAALNLLDVVTVYLLFLDYVLRWMTQDLKTGKKGWRAFAKYPFTPLAIVDLLAIAPSLGVLPESFKFLRVLRVAKLFRYSKSLTIVSNVFRSEKNTLLSVLAVAVMYIFISGLIMFVNEPDTFGTFFNALYWATTALTTIGYGDVYPHTDLGKLISMVSSLFGIAIIALPAGIITGGFLEEIRQCKADREAYFRRAEAKPYRGRTPFSYGSVRAYARAHPKVVAYGATMLACIVVNEGLYEAARALGAPVWLDTVGTALAAILLEPAAGLIVGFANNLLLAVQMGSAGELLYYALSAMSALAFGILLARGRKVTLRAAGWTALVVVVAESLVSCALDFALTSGRLTTAAEQMYGAALAGIGLPGPAVVLCSLLLDKLVDTAAVFALVVPVSRAVMGSRVDPARWFGSSAAPAGAAPAAAVSAPRYILGVDVGGARTKVAAFTREGGLVGMSAFDSRSVLADGSHAELAEDLRAALDEAGVEASQVAAVGLAVPGSVAAEESLKMFSNIDLGLRSYQAFLRSTFPQARVVSLDAADAAVLGDRWHGTSHERQAQSVAFVSLGARVRLRIVSRGRLLSEVHDDAAAFGSLRVGPGEGEADSLDVSASAEGLVGVARGQLERAGAAGEEAAAAFPDARSVLEAARRRDPAAVAAIEELADALGFALSQLTCLVRPDVIVLGGGLSEHADLFLAAVRARYRSCAAPGLRDVAVAASKLGDACGAHGAAFRALEEIEGR